MRFDFTLDVPRPRFVVVHYHFFKNAGSTIESILEREFAGEFATLHGLTAVNVFVFTQSKYRRAVMSNGIPLFRYRLLARSVG